MAFFSVAARRLVMEASKTMSTVGSLMTASRSVVHSGTLCSSASSRILASLRPTRIGSTWTLVPSSRVNPPASRIGRMERSRCWRYPIRPVMPFMAMRIVFVSKPMCPPLMSAVMLELIGKARSHCFMMHCAAPHWQALSRRFWSCDTDEISHFPEAWPEQESPVAASTLTEVARLAGVSPATASRVLNGSPGHPGRTSRSASGRPRTPWATSPTPRRRGSRNPAPA